MNEYFTINLFSIHNQLMMS